MDQLSELKAFCRAVEAGGFSAEAAANVSQVARQVMQPEEPPGVSLQLAAPSGVGIAITASFIMQGDLAQPSVTPVLPGYPMRSRGPYAGYPVSRHVSAKVRAFAEFAVDACRRPAWS